MLATRIGDTVFLLSLLRAELDRLEKLRRLENRMHTVAPADRPTVQGKIDEVMEEVASLNRTIQEHRATHAMTT
jgi:HAMP domain-containing protein